MKNKHIFISLIANPLYKKVGHLCKALCALLLFVLPTIHLDAHWRKQTNIPAPYAGNLWLDVFFLPSDPNYGWICGDSGAVLRTTDGGNTWTGRLVLPSRKIRFESIHFVSPSVGYTSGWDLSSPSTGKGYIFKTINGGITWRNVTPPESKSLWGCFFITADIGVVLGDGCDGHQHFFRTIDGGSTWTVFEGHEEESALSDAIIYSSTGLGYASGSGTIWRTLDGGKTWALLSVTGRRDWQEEITNQGQSFLVPVSAGCSGDSIGGIRFSSDLGSSWREFSTGPSMFGTFLLDGQRGWACGLKASLYYTPDAGKHWELQNCGIDPVDNLDDIWFVNDNTGWVVGNNIYKYETSPPLDTTVSVTGSNSLCEGDSVTLTAPPGYVAYKWSNGSTDRSVVISLQGEYFVTAFDSYGCPHRLGSHFISVHAHPDAAISAIGGLTFCKGDSVVLQAGPGYSYRWSNGAVTQSIVVQTSGEYSVTMIDEFGCSATSQTVQVTVRDVSNQLEFASNPDIFSFDPAHPEELMCRKITIRNSNTTQGFLLDALWLAKNVEFSIPPSQLPALLPPGGSLELTVCYVPSALGEQRDTIIVNDNCSPHRLPVIASGRSNIYTTSSRCGTPVTLKTVGIKAHTTIVFPPYPNPSTGNLSVVVVREGVLENTEHCILRDAFGSTVLQGTYMSQTEAQPQSHSEEGIFMLDTEHLSQGMYFLTISTQTDAVTFPVMLVR